MKKKQETAAVVPDTNRVTIQNDAKYTITGAEIGEIVSILDELPIRLSPIAEQVKQRFFRIAKKGEANGNADN